MKYFIVLLTIFLNLIELQSQTFNFYRTSPELMFTNDTFGITSHAKINNLTNGTNTLRLIKSIENFPAGWEACICDIVICHPPGVDTAEADYPSGLSNIDIMIYTHSIPGRGYLTVRAEKVSNPNEYINVIFGCEYNPIGITQISTIVKDFNLGQNYPNPFNPNTKINFSTPKSGYVSLIVYDILGKEVKALVNETLTVGEYEVDFEAGGLTSGIYYYILNADSYRSVKKMILIK